MRKIGAMFLTVILLCTGLVTGGCAAEDASGSAVDIVMLIDQSTSMKQKDVNESNDYYGYRFDAAQMVASMCDMNHSRIAFVPFGGSVEEYADQSFINMSDVATRKAKLQQIEDDREKGLDPNTDIGGALSAALHMLMSREDKTNKPMIILLTDGDSSIGSKENNFTLTDRTVYMWNEAAQSFEPTLMKAYTAEDSAKLKDKAISVACKQNVPVYTIALYNASSNTAELKERLDVMEGIANDTGGQYAMLSSKEVATLPLVFGDMFAAQVGSNLLRDLQVEPVDAKRGQYKVILPILNQSVMEANIYIPLRGIRKGSIALRNADGKNVSIGGQDVVMLETDKFRLYKICSPRVLGPWELSFTLENVKSEAADIAFSVLYNYDISLKTSVSNSAILTGAATQDELTIGKGEELYISSRFFDQSGVPSADSNLYKEQSGEAWQTIRASYTLEDSYGNVLSAGEMPVDTDHYVAQVKLGELKKNSKGFNDLRSGEYTLRVVVDGAGLHRENAVALHVENHAPRAQSQTIGALVTVDDPSDATTKNVQTVTVSLNDFVTDEDGDQVLFGEMHAVDDAATVIAMRIEPQEDGTFVATGDTIKDTAMQRFRSGMSRYQLTVTDSEGLSACGWDGSPLEMNLEVDVTSRLDNALNRYECVTSVTGVDAQNIAPKNSPVTFIMTLLDKNTQLADTTGEIANYQGQLYVYDAKNTSAYIQRLDFVPTEDGTGIRCEYDTTNTAAQYKFVCNYTYDGRSAGESTHEVTVLNTAPFVVEEEAKRLPTRITYDPLPAALSFLEKPATEQEMQVEQSKLFQDNDHQDELKFETPVFTCDNATVDPATVLSFTQEGTRLQYHPLKAGGVTVTLTAVDGDGEPATYTYHLSVESITAKWKGIGLLLLLLAAGITLLLLALHQARKPRFPKDAKLFIKENASLYASDEYELPPTKKTIPLDACMDDTLAEKCGIAQEKLQSVLLRPVRTVTGSIGVYCLKPDVIRATINGVDITRKTTEWPVGNELVLEGAHGTLHIQLAASAEEGYTGGHGNLDFGQEPDDGFSIGGTASFGGGSSGGFGGGSNAFGGFDDSFGVGGDNFGGADGGATVPASGQSGGSTFGDAPMSDDGFDFRG